MSRWRDPEPVQEAACGTPAGANRHVDHNEPVCQECKRAAARYRRELRRTDSGGGRDERAA